MKQPVVIKIGYMSFLLPDDTGAATVVKTLSKGVQCSYYGKTVELTADQECEVSLQYVPKGAKVVDSKGDPLPARKPAPVLRKLQPQHVPALGWRDDQRLF